MIQEQTPLKCKEKECKYHDKKGGYSLEVDIGNCTLTSDKIILGTHGNCQMRDHPVYHNCTSSAPR